MRVIVMVLTSAESCVYTEYNRAQLMLHDVQMTILATYQDQQSLPAPATRVRGSWS